MNDPAAAVKPDRLTPQESRGLAARCAEVKRWFVGLAAVALAIAAAVLAYRGPGRALVRGHLGDVAAPMLVYALLGLAWRARPAARAAATFAFALAPARSSRGRPAEGAVEGERSRPASWCGTRVRRRASS